MKFSVFGNHDKNSTQSSFTNDQPLQGRIIDKEQHKRDNINRTVNAVKAWITGDIYNTDVDLMEYVTEYGLVNPETNEWGVVFNTRRLKGTLERKYKGAVKLSSHDEKYLETWFNIQLGRESLEDEELEETKPFPPEHLMLEDVNDENAEV